MIGSPRELRQYLGRQFLSQRTTGVTVAGGAFTQTFTVPSGFQELCGFYFDPDQDISVTIFAQNVASNILTNFSTRIGTALGFINPRYITAPNDQLQITATPNVLTTTPRIITFTLEFK